MKPLVASFLIVLCTAATAPALSVFLSSSATDPSAVDPLIVPENSTADLYVWIRPDAGTKITTAAFDLFAGPWGGLTATGFQVQNPVVEGAAAWQGGIQSGDLPIYGSHIVDGSISVAGDSLGIDASLIGTGLDSREVDGAFLHGVLSLETNSWHAESVITALPSEAAFVVDGQETTSFDNPTFEICTVECVAGWMKGDTNIDGVFNTLDIDPFVQTLTAPEDWKSSHPGVPMEAVADFNLDGKVNTLDIDPFVTIPDHGVRRMAPEPATFALSALAIAGAGGLCRRRSTSGHR
ncbi:hypothetical protein Pla123a_06560 [Posidoniimonas polymericola]|uniref:PEP-CTERM protein-sorting domain-containing protein n=1 Tax=Posidoniimonas polymericola TaxID=2528002 RepID=A0A5C5ZEJ0_9BACT|nr:PEP-CTERM sorting domain-containing protein [Posidoniimonas polymericola]TWT85849.1 hypothetical protein Pla123a_06560 [Posidoniimonas polymericola]